MASYQLVMRAGPTPGKAYELNKNDISVGRDINNDIVVNDSEVSRKHARLLMQGKNYVLEDLGSTNGTFVDGQRLTGPHVLRPGETIMLGENVSVVFEGSFDADATMVSPSPAKPAYAPPPPPRETYIPPPPEQAPKAPPEPAKAAYSGQVPAGPPEPYYEAQQEQRSRRPWLIAGCGCLLIIIFLAIGLWAFDYLNLYCTGPFKVLSPIYELLLGGACPP